MSSGKASRSRKGSGSSGGLLGDSAPKRRWEGIVIDILQATVAPEKKMRIMYKANLNFDRFNSYFYDLLEKGFIEEVPNDGGRNRLFKLSDRGKTLLVTLRKAQDMFSGGEQ